MLILFGGASATVLPASASSWAPRHLRAHVRKASLRIRAQAYEAEALIQVAVLRSCIMVAKIGKIGCELLVSKTAFGSCLGKQEKTTAARTLFESETRSCWMLQPQLQGRGELRRAETRQRQRLRSPPKRSYTRNESVTVISSVQLSKLARCNIDWPPPEVSSA